MKAAAKPEVSAELGGVAGGSLRRATMRAGTEMFIAQWVKLVCQFGSTMIMSRLLAPAEVGLVAMVTAVTGVLQVFRDGGLSTATVQREEITDAQVSTLFWVNAGLGLLLTAICVALSWPMAAFYHEPRLTAVTLALSFTFLIGALGVQHDALLRRQMRFRALAVVEIASMLAGSGAGIAMAWSGWGYWSLVGQQLAMSLTCLVGLVIAMPWRPGKPQREARVSSMLRFGGFLTGSELMNYLFRNMDNVLIGWRWGAGPLGFYAKAYGLLMLAITQINAPVARVAVAALCRVQQEPERMRRYFLSGYGLVAAINLPVMAALVVFAEETIAFVLGSQWSESVTLFRVLMPAAVSGALLNPFGWLFMATGRPDRQMRLGMVWSSLLIIAFFVGLPHGPAGVALAYSTMSCAMAVPLCFYAVRGTAVRVTDLWLTIRWPAVAAMAAGAFGYAVKEVLPVDWPVAVRAIGGCGLVCVAYALVLLVAFGQWRHYRELLGQVRPA